MYGSPPEFVWGKMTKKKVSRAIVDESILFDEKKQVLYSDIMHLNSNKLPTVVCRIKEIYRSVKAGLKWKLPPTMVKDLVAYAVSWINIHRTMTINLIVCPRVLFTGM